MSIMLCDFPMRHKDEFIQSSDKSDDKRIVKILFLIKTRKSSGKDWGRSCSRTGYKAGGHRSCSSCTPVYLQQKGNQKKGLVQWPHVWDEESTGSGTQELQRSRF